MPGTLNASRARLGWLALALGLAPALAAPLSAQLPSASASALGMGDNYTALARGFNALAWNPAGLGIKGAPRSSFTILSVRGLAGLDPITTKELKGYEGQLVPASVRKQWLDEITAEGSQAGNAGTDLTYVAAQAGRFGIQIGSEVRATADLSPGAAQLLLFGNAGRTGQAESVSLSGSSFNVAATTTFALGYAQPLMQTETGSLALGATVKYVLGNLMFTGVDVGSQVGATPLAVRLQFPVVQTDTIVDVSRLNNGSGVGLDLGLAWQGAQWAAGVAVRNVVNTFEWDRSKLYFRPGTALLNSDSTDTDFGARPFASAPAALQERVDQLAYQPLVSAGLAFQPNRRITVSADFRRRLEESSLGEPTTHVGVGAEVRPLMWLPIRVGGAAMDGGHLLSGGASLELGIIGLTGSVASRVTDLGTDTMGMFTFSAGVGARKR